MKVAYLIDKEAIGGGNEYVLRKIASRKRDICRVFYASKNECTIRQLNKWGADEIVVNHLKALLQLFVNPFKCPKGRVIFVVHGVHLRKYIWKMNEQRGMRIAFLFQYYLRRGVEAILYRRCNNIIALTDDDKKAIMHLYGRNLPVTVESNTLEGWEPHLAENCPPGVVGPYEYLCIGRFSYQKGQDRWIRFLHKNYSYTAESSNQSSGRTLFIGDGETFEACRKLSIRLGVSHICTFAGAIAEADKYLKCAKTIVSPSRWEGMPYLLMKARSLGCRILATDCPGNHEVLDGYDYWKRLEL